MEETPDEYVSKLVAIFRLVRPVLRDDGTLWLNIGDSSSGSGVNDGTKNPGLSKDAQRGEPKRRPGTKVPPGLKPKDLIGIPDMLAFALRADGWWLRRKIIWHKPNFMPESVKDRPTGSYEYILLMAKSRRYYYDVKATRVKTDNGGHNLSDVWIIPTVPYPEAHFATYPPDIV